jgi:hypothetical protein
MSNGNSGSNPPKTFTYKAVAGGNWPDYQGSWEVNFEDEVEFTYYQNLANDMIAALFAKLGQEFSKWRLDQDTERLAKSLDAMQTALSGGILDEYK